MDNTKKCTCSPLNDFKTCDEQTKVFSGAVDIVVDTNTIQPTDQILIIRGDAVYKASWDEVSSQTALLILTKATQSMPKTDPADGKTLWNDNGFIKIASGNPNDLGMQSQTSFDKNLQIAISNLPTTDPGDGSPWLCGGVVMRGSNNTTKGCE